MGGDKKFPFSTHWKSCFNPRPRMGGDFCKLSGQIRNRYVSIHAPVWGATCFCLIRHKGRILFQSTPPYGGRPTPYCERCWFYKFQSTPPYGGRHINIDQFNLTSLFQSTPPYGGRPITKLLLSNGGGIVSIHAPVWGATDVLVRNCHWICYCFNPRPRMGGDCLLLSLCLKY